MPDDLVSVRGLVDSDFDNPLREFDGLFDGYDTAPAQGYSGTRVDLKFLDIDNVVTAPGQAYNFPTAVINLGLSNKNKSKWGYFANSLAKLLPSDEDIKDQKGKRLKLVYCDGQDGRPAPKPIWNRDADPGEYPDKMVPTPVWTVAEVAGSAAAAGGETVDAAAWAEENLIGKTKAQFNKWAFADATVRKDTGLQRSITDKSFINALIQMGKVAEDSDGVFQKVEG